MWITKVGAHTQRRDIVWTIAYGSLAHANEETRKMVEEWRKSSMVWELVKFEFQSTLLELLDYIQRVCELNKKALSETSGHSSIRS